MILILNGSPNKDSKTLSMAKELLSDTKEEKIYIDTYTLNIISCDDCKYCSTKIGCSKRDDMDKLHLLFEQANTLIIASPVYFGALSDKTMVIINRFQRYFSQRFDLKDPNIPFFENLILITSQGSKQKSMLKGPNEIIRILEMLFKPIYTYKISNTNSDIVHPLENKKTIKQIDNLKKKITH